jgi:D-alanyl-D-alanine carboxypeptidase
MTWAGDRVRRLAVRGAIAVALAGVWAGVAGAGSAAPAGTPALEQAMDELVAAGVPGVVVLVRDGDRKFQLARGYADLASETPMRVKDRFRVASLTKTFVATVVLELVGERRLRLDDTVERWLPGRISNGASVTVRHLLNHTSGIYDAVEDPAILAPYLGGDLTHLTSPDEVLDVAAAHGPLFPPGSNWSYSNTNYFVLGMIVEAASGHTISSELRRRIFRPLRLHHTTFPSSSRIAGRHARGYFRLGGPDLVDVTEFSPSLFWAGGAVVSTAADSARFYRALLRGRLLRPGLLEAMLTIDPVAMDPSGSGSGFALGLQREGRFPCGAAWGHTGELPGYEAYAWNSRDGDRQVVVLINTSGLANHVRNALTNLFVLAYCGT